LRVQTRCAPRTGVEVAAISHRVGEARQAMKKNSNMAATREATIATTYHYA
jgi:hypothetical protein